MKYLNKINVTSDDVRRTINALEKRLAYWKENCLYAVYEIRQMETAIDVLSDLVLDVDEYESRKPVKISMKQDDELKRG